MTLEVISFIARFTHILLNAINFITRYIRIVLVAIEV